MKEAIIVDADGYMTEVTLVADDVTGVFPMFKPHQITESTEELQQPSPEITGYIIAIAVPSGLYKPKFDFNAWELYNKLLDPEIYSKNRNIIYKNLQELNLWIEGLTSEEPNSVRTHSIQSAATEKNLTFTEKMKNKHQQLVSIYKRLLK
ncbi:hypothetical protein YDYSG_41210 [Paenibacillus tyrfis]|uniref:hypothetical protein n=1 Tax=Paenibacillus tyrfis TaxID=1501230 RepID=UPI0024901F0A|nr:hypothetical protein [Paenibacillus tyrfis]GLI08091.1 hypothetical protein YDYSG_41210 [Paenibacillus tyrfis]